MGMCRILLLCTTALIAASASEDYKITPIQTSSGLYYEKIGEVSLSNSNWQFVTSVDYNGYLAYYQYLFTKASEIQGFCQKVNLKECDDRYNSIRSNLDRIEERDESMANFLGITTKYRVRRSFWGAIGGFFSKIGKGLVDAVGISLLGGSSHVDLSAYDRQLGELRSGQREMQNELNLQRTAFLVDSERKDFQIQLLNKAQDDIKDKIVVLEGTFQKDSAKKDKELKELRNMLDETQAKITMQGEIQRKLVGQVGKIEQKLLSVDEDIKMIYKEIADNKNQIEFQALITKLNSISIDFSFLMTQFESEQKTLFEVIRNANRGELDPYILTPLNLVEMLQAIQPNLSEDMKFPFYPNIENAHKLYNTIKPSAYLYNNRVIFILQIPLVQVKTYRLHKVTSLPQPFGSNKFAFIQPQEPFMIIDKNYQEYMLLSSNDFKDFCNKIGETKYMCKQIHQVSFEYKSDDCEVVLFKTPKKIPSSCDARLIHLDKPIFLQLQQPRSWVYAVPDTEILIISCGNDRETVHLEGAGFIQLKGDCSVRTPHFELVSLLEFSSPVESNYTAPLNLATAIDTTHVEEIEEKSAIRKQILLPFDLEELDRISLPIKKSETNLASSHAVTYVIISIILVIIAGVFAYLIYKGKIRAGHVFTFINKINRPSSSIIPEHDGDELDCRLKLNKDNIKRISVHDEPGAARNDYYSVRFVMKKQPNDGKQLNNKECSKEKMNLLGKNLSAIPEIPEFKKQSKDVNDFSKVDLVKKSATLH